MIEKKKRKLTEEEIRELIKVEDGDWWTHTQYSFYAEIKDGKVTVPKEIMDQLEVKDGDLVSLIIEIA